MTAVTFRSPMGAGYRLTALLAAVAKAPRAVSTQRRIVRGTERLMNSSSSARLVAPDASILYGAYFRYN
jgi:hypothetical protein